MEFMESARFLERLLSAGANVKYALKAFQLKGENYAPGTLVIARGENPELNIDSLIIQASKGLQ